jgi:hypothetical protein
MATKKIIGLAGTGIPGTIGAGDDGTISGTLTVSGISTLTGAVTASANVSANTASVTNDLTVGGDLNVTGDIVSGGTTNTITSDDFIDLANGYENNTVIGAGGFTVQTASISGWAGAITCNAFTASDAGLTKNKKTLTVATVPSNGENIIMTNPNQAYRINFVNDAAQPVDQTDTVFNSAGIAEINIESITTSVNAIGAAFRVLFASLDQYTTDGASPGPTCGIIAGNNSEQLVLVFTDGTPDTAITSASAGTSDGQAPFVTLASDAAAAGFASNDLISITAANDAGNVGLFVISSVDGSDVFIKGNTSVDIAAQTPFAQNEFQADATIAGTAIQPRIFVNAVSNGTSFLDDQSPAVAIPVGLPIYAYSAAGTEAQFTADGSYKIIGADAASSGTTLQMAYDAGATITTDGTGDITFNIDTSEDFVIDGQAAGTGQVLFGTTTDIDVFTVNTDDELTLLGGTDATDATNGISITSSRTGEVENPGTTTQGAAMHLESDGGISVEAAKNIAIMGDEVETIVRFTAYAPIRANGAISLVHALGTASLATADVDSVPANASTLSINNGNIATAQEITFDNTVAVGASDIVFDTNAAVVGVQAPATDVNVATAICTLMNSIGGAADPVFRASVLTSVVTIYSNKYGGATDDVTWVSNVDITTAVVNSVPGVATYAHEAGSNDPALTYNVVAVNASDTLIALGAESGFTMSGITEISCSEAITTAMVGQPVYIATDVPVSNVSAAGQVLGAAPSATNTTIFKVGIAMGIQATPGSKFKVLLQPQFIGFNAG